MGKKYGRKVGRDEWTNKCDGNVITWGRRERNTIGQAYKMDGEETTEKGGKEVMARKG
jgi:hypothetical protein